MWDGSRKPPRLRSLASETAASAAPLPTSAPPERSSAATPAARPAASTPSVAPHRVAPRPHQDADRDTRSHRKTRVEGQRVLLRSALAGPRRLKQQNKTKT